jgi:hypothetical protein
VSWPLTAGCGGSPSGGGRTARPATATRAAVSAACDDIVDWDFNGGSVTKVEEQLEAQAPGTAVARDLSAWVNGTAQNTKFITDCRPYYQNVLSHGPAAQPAPTCNPSGWEGNNIGGEPTSVATDLNNIATDVNDQDELSLSSDGRQLNTDALAALHDDLPPSCSQPLYHDVRMMLLGLAIAGSALYLGALNLAGTTSLNNLAAKDLSRATRFYKVEPTCGNC